jgi:hypothetical protein
MRRLVGAATYAADHPLNRVEADLRGLEGQAPAHAGAARAVAGPPPAPVRAATEIDTDHQNRKELR